MIWHTDARGPRQRTHSLLLNYQPVAFYSLGETGREYMKHSAQTKRVSHKSWLTKLGISKSHRKGKSKHEFNGQLCQPGLTTQWQSIGLDVWVTSGLPATPATACRPQYPGSWSHWSWTKTGIFVCHVPLSSPPTCYLETKRLKSWCAEPILQCFIDDTEVSNKTRILN